MNDIDSLINDLTNQMKSTQKYVVDTYNRFRELENSSSQHGIASFHATIGGKNNTFTSRHSQFLSADQYIAEWIRGLIEKYADNVRYGTDRRYIIFEMFKDEICARYIYLFLERTFYRHIKEMQRKKPDDVLWDLRFGNKLDHWGLLISPVKRNNEWTNDVSEIRKAKFEYWTVGHMLHTGVLDTKNNCIKPFSSIEDIESFYINIIKKESKSWYEKRIIDMYVDYLNNSQNVYSEPLIIPELRYDGKEIKHKYRLDFTILNAYSDDYIGVEISPFSSHMSITEDGDQDKNDALREKWQREIDKRNEYYTKYGIKVLTFADEDLKDLERCFSKIEHYLTKKDRKHITLDEAKKQLKKVIDAQITKV